MRDGKKCIVTQCSELRRGPSIAVWRKPDPPAPLAEFEPAEVVYIADMDIPE